MGDECIFTVKNMEDKEFRFQGLDAKTELHISLVLVIPALIMMIGTLYLSHLFVSNTFFLFPIIIAALITILGSITLLKIMTNRIKEKEWIIRINDQETITARFRNYVYNFNMTDIVMIKNMGNEGVRYLTIKTSDKFLKIRVGHTGFAPFSSDEDINKLDAFIDYLRPYIDQNFNTKVLKNAINPNVIPNFGVFVRKGEKIKYSIINKMQPWQVIAMILSIGIIIMILFFNIMEYYFFK